MVVSEEFTHISDYNPDQALRSAKESAPELFFFSMMHRTLAVIEYAWADMCENRHIYGGYENSALSLAFTNALRRLSSTAYSEDDTKYHVQRFCEMAYLSGYDTFDDVLPVVDVKGITANDARELFLSQLDAVVFDVYKQSNACETVLRPKGQILEFKPKNKTP